MSNGERISQSVDYPKPLSIHHLLEIQGDRRANAVAIAGLGNSLLSFRRLLLQVEQAAKTLNALGIGRNDRVAMVTPNGPETASAFFAVSSAATFAPLNPACRTNEFDFYLTDLGAKALIVQSSADSPAIEVARKHAIAIIELSAAAESDTGIFSIQGEGLPALSDGDFAQADDIALILYTSGTTARPKMVPLTHANLLASAGNIAATLKLTEKDRCLNVMPLFHIHGLVGAVLSSIMAGSAVACTSGFDLEQFFPWLEEVRPTWYTAVPTMHQAISNRAKANRKIITNCPLRLIRSSSAPLPPTVTAELEDLFKVPVIEAYGMTEASHQIASNPLPPRQRKAGSVGVATGSEIAIVDEQGQFLSAGIQGEILIRGANITRGYQNHPEANREAFTDGWFRTGDQGYLDEDGYLFITGRLKEIINRGGEKISPREVDEVLIDHPAVAQVVTFAIPHPTLGEDVATAIVLHESASATEREIREFAAKRLTDFKVPRQIFIVKEIPEGPTGKLRRVGLAEKLTKASDQPQTLPAESIAHRTPLEKALAEIWAEVLGLEQVDAQDNFFYLGGDSILATLVASRVRRVLQLELSLVSFFEKPTVAEMALGLETDGKAASASQPLTLQPISRDREIPLSHGQERMWFIDQLEPGNSLYNRPIFLRLKGDLKAAVLEQCLNEIIRRHEILRTTFPAVNGQPLQVVSPFQPLALSVRDMSGLPEGEREAETRRQAADEAALAFDLHRGPLIRAGLLCLGEDEHILLLTMHHIVFDGWSEGVLFQELAVLYESFSTGQPAPLSELPIQYADFAVWQRQWLQGEKFDSQLAYWREQLAGAPVLELPTDHLRPSVQIFRGSQQFLFIPNALTVRLKALSRAEGTTLFMTLLAAFQTLLHRYTGKDDILVGSPVAGRNRTDIEALIGFFVNTLILRADLSGDPSFRELLGRVRKVALEAYAHQDLPFEKLVEELQPERNLSRSPLFQVLFVLQNFPTTAPRLTGLTVTPVKVESETATFDLSLLLVEEANGLQGTIEHNTDLFDEATISRMIGHFQTLLESIVADPATPISRLALLTDSERNRLLVDRNSTSINYPKDRCIHQLFEAEVERTPEAIAAVFEDGRLTYRELNARANRLAYDLNKLGVGPETLVGLCVERSLEMIVGILGVLKAGGAYVPLDPSYPEDRLAFLLEDSGIKILLTQERVKSCLPPHNAQVMYLDTLDPSAGLEASEALTNPVSRTTADNAAYVIYTSGSTGKPKGVVITHHNVTRLLEATHSWFHFDRSDTWTLFHSYAFDFSVWEIWGSLLYGGRLVVVPYWVSRSPEMFYQLLSQEKVTVLNQTPSAFGQLIEVERSSMHAHDLALRLVLFGGEALDFQILKPWFDRHGDQRPQLVNMYGITETTVHVTYRPITAGNLSTSGGSLIGKPIPDLELYVLDQSQNLVPIGVPGELYVGGAGVGRGYLNRPELTAERFIPNPFRLGAGNRLYRSGDLVRYLPNRDLEYRGRIDAQIKIRGFRIELGEIEAVLRQHTAVREVVVLAREDSAEKRLVAYVVPAQQAPTISELNGFLRQKLPEYMVPSAFMFLDALPLTANGKVDRRNLPGPDQSRPEQESSFVAPRTPVEELLAQIWAEVLKLDQVGVHDNFFELGGHSLLLTQVASRIQRAFLVLLPLRILFDAPTIADLSAAIAAAQLGQEDAAEVARIVEELKQLSPDEVTALLEAERRLRVAEDKL
jgi:amino acid adenylation domain-containing protein